MNTLLYRSPFCFVFGVIAASTLLGGCSSPENKDALPHTSTAQVQQARQANIDRIKNDPKIPEDQKARALQYMQGGPGAPKPLGATDTNSAPKP